MVQLAEYQEHLIAFVDLLGFKDAIREKKGHLVEIQELLSAISILNTDHKIEVQDSNGSIVFKPSITAFSDHLVISYPLAPFAEKGVGPDISLVGLQRALGKIMIPILASSFLIRGGITIGNLYHHQNVVFGDALVEAYDLESKIAIYPRVIISPNAFLSLKASRTTAIFQDYDGIFSLDYILDSVGFLMSKSKDGEFKECTEWCAKIRKNIKDNIANFKKTGNLSQLMKWVWFDKYFEKSLSQFPDSLLSKIK